MDYTLPVLDGYDDEVGIVCGDEEDGDTGQCQWGSEVDDARPGLHARGRDS